MNVSPSLFAGKPDCQPFRGVTRTLVAVRCTSPKRQQDLTTTEKVAVIFATARKVSVLVQLNTAQNVLQSRSRLKLGL